MILSNISIHKALDDKSLRIEPEPRPRVKSDDGSKCPYQTSAVDLKLGDEIAFFKDGIPARRRMNVWHAARAAMTVARRGREVVDVAEWSP